MPPRRLCVLICVLLIPFCLSACVEESDIEIADLTFNGIEQVDKDALTSALQTKKGSWIPWGRKRYFDRSSFQADLKRIEAFYRDRGFPDARVSSFDVKFNETQTKVDVVVNISEGDPIRVAGVEIQGFDVLSEKERKDLLEQLPLQPEAPLDRHVATASRDRALNALREQGYFYADVSIQEEEVGPRRTKVMFAASAGPLTHVGPIEIVGQRSVGEDVVRRQLTFKPGDVFTQSKLRQSQRNLYQLELFEFVNVTPRTDTPQQSTEIPARVTVAEGKHQRVTTALGYGSEEKARARLRWDHVNFLGNARHAGVETKWSSLDRGVRLDYTEPYLFAEGFSLRIEGQAWRAAEPLYQLDSLGGRATLRRRVDTNSTVSVSLINEYQHSVLENEALLDLSIRDELISLGLDPRSGESSGTLSALAFDFNRTTANNLLDARRGYALSMHFEQAAKWLRGDFDYWSVNGEARHYLSLGSHAVFANRLRVGGIDSRGDVAVDVPFYRRFFLGGSSSIRGWGRFEVSPLSASGLPIGGLTMIEGSTELRVPLWGKLSGVAFLDYGNVWPSPWDIDLSDLRYAVGPGFRYLTPVGPVRIDLGYQLTPIEGLLVNGVPEERRYRLHFSIGQAF